jgi:Gram-negative bacterial TonB protein C-terminal
MLDWQIMSVRRHLGLLLATGLLAIAPSQLAYPQQPKPGDPQASKPPGLILKIAAPNSAGVSAPPKIEQLSDLASRLLHYTSDAGCTRSDCKILVTNFVFPDGNTSAYGNRLADALSSLIAQQDKTIEVVNRKLFHDLLQEQRISSKLQNSESGARWLGTQLNATLVLVGETKKIQNDLVEVSGRFLNVNDENRIGPSAEVNLLVDQVGDLLATHGLLPLPLLPPLPETLVGEKIYRAGLEVSVPSCNSTPNPPSTEAASRANFSGTIFAEGVVAADGTMKAARIVQGAPFGLDEAVIKALRTWKCNPGTLEGKPVATLIPIEVTIRIFRQH